MNKPALHAPILARHLATHCRGCGRCARECEFLSRHGLPRRWAEDLLARPHHPVGPAFDCNLCGLCQAVCPRGLAPHRFFLSLRQRATAPPPASLTHRLHERAGQSALLSWYGLPQHCDTVFFPGCALPGLRPETVFTLFTALGEMIPRLGMVLDCCGAPSLALGRNPSFQRKFSPLEAILRRHGIRRLITACPTCYRTLDTHLPGISVEMAYGLLPPAPGQGKDTVTLHDPCVLRFHPQIHHGVREMIQTMGFKIKEMAHHGKTTLCCGLGGGKVSSRLARNWREKRQRENPDLPLVTYCAGCTQALAPNGPTLHLLDLWRHPGQDIPQLLSRPELSRLPRGMAPYANRLALKRHLQRLPHLSLRGNRRSLPGPKRTTAG